jgi:hypothetical protein
MGFREREKKRLSPLKPSLFSLSACIKGTYKSNPSYRDFCLNNEMSQENLHELIRIDALKYFKEREIEWHDGIKNNPSNHLLCSQSFCVNSLFPFYYVKESLKNILKELNYDVKEVLKFELDKGQIIKPGFIAFEWIGEKNYLKELKYGKVVSDKSRSRGKGFTSADFAIRFIDSNDCINIILGEWKYSERYGTKSKQHSKSKTDRYNIYKDFLIKGGPIILNPTLHKALFFDPFDQLMRLQLLANEMETKHEMGARKVSVLHIAPKANEDLMNNITSKELVSIDNNIHKTWANIVDETRFKGIYTEDFLNTILLYSKDKSWQTYMKLRYTF